MPEANKIKKDEMMVDIDTSGPEAEVSLPEENIEQVATDRKSRNRKSRNNRTRKSRNKRR